jgi:hypothetical protein
MPAQQRHANSVQPAHAANTHTIPIVPTIAIRYIRTFLSLQMPANKSGENPDEEPLQFALASV